MNELESHYPLDQNVNVDEVMGHDHPLQSHQQHEDDGTGPHHPGVVALYQEHHPQYEHELGYGRSDLVHDEVGASPLLLEALDNEPMQFNGQLAPPLSVSLGDQGQNYIASQMSSELDGNLEQLNEEIHFEFSGQAPLNLDHNQEFDSHLSSTLNHPLDSMDGELGGVGQDMDVQPMDQSRPLSKVQDFGADYPPLSAEADGDQQHHHAQYQDEFRQHSQQQHEAHAHGPDQGYQHSPQTQDGYRQEPSQMSEGYDVQGQQLEQPNYTHDPYNQHQAHQAYRQQEEFQSYSQLQDQQPYMQEQDPPPYSQQQEPYSQQQDQQPYSHQQDQQSFNQQQDQQPYSHQQDQQPYNQQQDQQPYNQQQDQQPYNQQQDQQSYNQQHDQITYGQEHEEYRQHAQQLPQNQHQIQQGMGDHHASKQDLDQYEQPHHPPLMAHQIEQATEMPPLTSDSQHRPLGEEDRDHMMLQVGELNEQNDLQQLHAQQVSEGVPRADDMSMQLDDQDMHYKHLQAQEPSYDHQEPHQQPHQHQHQQQQQQPDAPPQQQQQTHQQSHNEQHAHEGAAQGHPQTYAQVGPHKRQLLSTQGSATNSPAPQAIDLQNPTMGQQYPLTGLQDPPQAHDPANPQTTIPPPPQSDAPAPPLGDMDAQTFRSMQLAQETYRQALLLQDSNSGGGQLALTEYAPVAYVDTQANGMGGSHQKQQQQQQPQQQPQPQTAQRSSQVSLVQQQYPHASRGNSHPNGVQASPAQPQAQAPSNHQPLTQSFQVQLQGPKHLGADSSSSHQQSQAQHRPLQHAEAQGQSQALVLSQQNSMMLTQQNSLPTKLKKKSRGYRTGAVVCYQDWLHDASPDITLCCIKCGADWRFLEGVVKKQHKVKMATLANGQVVVRQERHRKCLAMCKPPPEHKSMQDSQLRHAFQKWSDAMATHQAQMSQEQKHITTVHGHQQHKQKATPQSQISAQAQLHQSQSQQMQPLHLLSSSVISHVQTPMSVQPVNHLAQNTRVPLQQQQTQPQPQQQELKHHQTQTYTFTPTYTPPQPYTLPQISAQSQVQAQAQPAIQYQQPPQPQYQNQPAQLQATRFPSQPTVQTKANMPAVTQTPGPIPPVTQTYATSHTQLNQSQQPQATSKPQNQYSVKKQQASPQISRVVPTPQYPQVHPQSQTYAQPLQQQAPLPPPNQAPTLVNGQQPLSHILDQGKADPSSNAPPQTHVVFPQSEVSTQQNVITPSELHNTVYTQSMPSATHNEQILTEKVQDNHMPQHTGTASVQESKMAKGVSPESSQATKQQATVPLSKIESSAPERQQEAQYPIPQAPAASNNIQSPVQQPGTHQPSAAPQVLGLRAQAVPHQAGVKTQRTQTPSQQTQAPTQQPIAPTKQPVLAAQQTQVPAQHTHAANHSANQQIPTATQHTQPLAVQTQAPSAQVAIGTPPLQQQVQAQSHVLVDSPVQV
ncbi:hypothetical protein SARC_04938 [Sphaeroforma arctica JP610]|uniref:Uncharacterized protein n=1 Tax=Sphaeroforma arctica JP610 TaxID=667725 RepID=A0A0L0G120_9EUKA|nr:hypothetical protein SARC_04938 [Sphaeroforma arctica JP610]KNC82780.1 hypothetical protein SARC_04938 [Sphaeroforma arctica JP610]|eukprot:XP_014156682.1 hypothetical protein SARC_04938 [Sphaeroforma arctica JP610]